MIGIPFQFLAWATMCRCMTAAFAGTGQSTPPVRQAATVIFFPGQRTVSAEAPKVQSRSAAIIDLSTARRQARAR